MMQKIQRRMCLFLVHVLLLTGVYMTYIRAESFAERAASTEAARQYASEWDAGVVTQLTTFPKEQVTAEVCLVESINPAMRTVIGRVTGRSSFVHRDLRVTFLLLCALWIAFFILNCRLIEEILCLCEKKYRTALIKYIHDMDGKKRVACLT